MSDEFSPGHGLKGRWRTSSVDEFGTTGLIVITRCSFCNYKFEGHRDEGREWFEKHMQNRHSKKYAELKAIPTKRKRKYQRTL